jgi:hypothetical protein
VSRSGTESDIDDAGLVPVFEQVKKRSGLVAGDAQHGCSVFDKDSGCGETAPRDVP